MIGAASLCMSVPAWAESQRITAQELLSRLDREDAPLVLDVRTAREYAAGHVPGAKNVPLGELSGAMAAVLLQASDGREVVVYCEKGPRAARAEVLLRETGFEAVLHLEGDMSGWRAAKLPTATPTSTATGERTPE
jgi:rhodanese-related sulfurtransferase